MTEAQLVHVIDYNDAGHDSLDLMLSEAGYRVEHWANGEAFLSGADNSQAACALLDIRLPGLSGLEVQARMPAAGLDLPVILLTGHGDIAMAVQAMKAGAADILEQPIDRDSLLRSVEDAFVQIGEREAHREREQWAHLQLAKLTDPEREVLDGLACGYPNQAIAHDLGMSLQTVEACRDNVVTKLEVGNFADALRIAFAASWDAKPNWPMAHGMVRKPRSA